MSEERRFGPYPIAVHVARFLAEAASEAMEITEQPLGVRLERAAFLYALAARALRRAPGSKTGEAADE